LSETYRGLTEQDREDLLHIRAYRRELQGVERALDALPPVEASRGTPADAEEVLQGLPEKLENLLRAAPASQRTGVQSALRVVKEEIRRYKE